MSKFQHGNTNAQKGDSKRVPWYGMIDPATKDAIRRLASDLGLSQSEVVDMWRELWEKQEQYHIFAQDGDVPFVRIHGHYSMDDLLVILEEMRSTYYKE